MIFVGFKNIDIEELILKILIFFFIFDTVLQTVHGSNCLVAVSWPGRNRNRKGSIITKLHWTAKKYPQLRVSGLRLADSDFDHIPKKNVQKNVRCLQILQRFWFRIRVFKTTQVRPIRNPGSRPLFITGWPRSYRIYILQITQNSQYRYADLKYTFAVTSGSPSSMYVCI